MYLIELSIKRCIIMVIIILSMREPLFWFIYYKFLPFFSLLHLAFRIFLLSFCFFLFMFFCLILRPLLSLFVTSSFHSFLRLPHSCYFSSPFSHALSFFLFLLHLFLLFLFFFFLSSPLYLSPLFLLLFMLIFLFSLLISLFSSSSVSFLLSLKHF